MALQPVTAQTFSDMIFSMKEISKTTIVDHLKLYQGYVNSYNKIVDLLKSLTDEELAVANATYSKVRELKIELTYAWGGVVSHEMYFSHLGGTGGEPSGKLADQINNDFGSFANFKKEMKATGMAARGWAWLCWNKRDKALFNYLGDWHNTYLVWEVIPIMALDVYEHAYYIDYGPKRAEYIGAYFNNLDWGVIEKNFSQIPV